jgi:hypothetical protein
MVLFDTGKKRLMRLLMKGDGPPLDGNVEFHLMSTYISIDSQTPITELTEVSMPGYAPLELVGALEEGIDTNDQDTWLWPSVQVLCTSNPGVPIVAYGYYTTYVPDGTLLWGQMFAVPPTFAIEGDEYSFPVQLSMSQCCPSGPALPFGLLAFDAFLAEAEATEFMFDADLSPMPEVAFSVDASLWELAAEGFAFDASLEEVAFTQFDIDAFTVQEEVEYFTIGGLIAKQIETDFSFDADLTLFITVSRETSFDALVENKYSRSFTITASLETKTTKQWTIDALLSMVRQFAVDAYLFELSASGVMIYGPGSYTFIVPAGVHTLNAYIWGQGGNGAATSSFAGCGGGGGGGYTQKHGGTVTPGAGINVVVGAGGTLTVTQVGFPGQAYQATYGAAGNGNGGGTGGVGAHGDVNYTGGSGGAGFLSFSYPLPGGGGGSSAGPAGNGNTGGTATATLPGAGATPVSGMGGGGQGGSITAPTAALNGLYPGGGGGGAERTPTGFGTAGTGAGGLVILTWGADAHFIDAYVQKATYDTFTLDADLKGMIQKTFTIDAAVAHRYSAFASFDGDLEKTRQIAFTVDAQTAAKSQASFTIGATVASMGANGFGLDAQLASPDSAAASFDALLANRGTTSTTFSALLGSPKTVTVSVDALLVALRNDSFTIDAAIAARRSATFSFDADLLAIRNKTFTADAVLAALSVGDNFTIDADIVSSLAPTVTMAGTGYASFNGGTTIGIAGTNFTGATAVHFGSAAATSYTVSSSVTIFAVAPAATSGTTVDTTVTNTYGTSGTSPADQVFYCAVADNFNDANGTTIQAHTPHFVNETGGVYSVSNGAWHIESLALIQNGSTTTGTEATIAKITSANGNETVSAQITAPSTQWQAGVIARYSAANKYYELIYDSSTGLITLGYVFSGGTTALATYSFTWASGAQHTLALSVNGSTLKGYLDGSLLFTQTDTNYASTVKVYGMLSYVYGSYTGFATFQLFLVY